MSHHATPAINSQEVGRILWKYRLRWIVPTLLCTAIAVVYACVAPSKWQASQTLQVRDEAIGRDDLGRFGEPESRKTAHETIVDLAKGKTAVINALKEVGPPASVKEGANWPSIDDVESLQYAIEVSAPVGAALGDSDLIYIRVRDNDRQRAGLLTSALCQAVDSQLRQLRAGKYHSLAGELQNAVLVARNDLSEATARITKIESEVGDDLSELRLLSYASSGESSLRQSLVQLETELRTARTQQHTRSQLLQSIEDAATGDETVPELSTELVTLLPVLRDMKTNLTEAQNRTAVLLGERTDNHPAVKTARTAEAQLRGQLQKELTASAAALRGDLRIGESRIESLTKHRDAITTRMQRLAEVRADYSNLTVEVNKRNEALSKAQESLSQAQANAKAAQGSTLITMLDEPILSDRPIGLSKSAIIAAGFVAGLLMGLGIVFLTAPNTIFTPETVTDQGRSSESDRTYVLQTPAPEAEQPAVPAEPERRPLSPAADMMVASFASKTVSRTRTRRPVAGYDRTIKRTQKRSDINSHLGLSLSEALERIESNVNSAYRS